MNLDERRVAMGTQVGRIDLVNQLRELASFHDAMRDLCLEHSEGREDAKATYHGTLMQAANQAADHFQGMN